MRCLPIPRPEPHSFREYKASLMFAFTSGGMRALDIGCGMRQYSYFCKAGEYVGIDVNGCVDVIASVSHLPFRDESFDRLVMFDVLEHVRDVVLAIKECKRVLRPYGRILILTPNTLGFGVYDSFADPSHRHHFSWKGLRNILRSCGFTIDSEVPLHLHIFWPLRFLKSRKLRYLQQSICLVGVRHY